MAKVGEDRLWMRRMSVEAKQAEVDRWNREMAEDAERDATTCPYCFHDRHEYRWDIATVNVLYCRTEGCLCGVYPCLKCGGRSRAETEILTEERCADCGHSWLSGPIA